MLRFNCRRQGVKLRDITNDQSDPSASSSSPSTGTAGQSLPLSIPREAIDAFRRVQLLGYDPLHQEHMFADIPRDRLEDYGPYPPAQLEIICTWL